MTGGSHSDAFKSAELLHGDGSPWCALPDLPDGRYDHTGTGLEVCGGGGSAATLVTCARLSGGRWSPGHSLERDRWQHCSWASPQGLVLLGGGNYGLVTTELLEEASADSVQHFPLKYATW